MFDLGYLCFSAGKTLGILAVSLSANLENINSYYSFALLLILLSLVWVEFGSMLTGKDQRSANRLESPARVESQHDPFMQRCDQVMTSYRLSPREQDVFMLLARGHTMTFIAQTLSVSRETVKSHVQNIYQKLDVHSKEALIGLVESVELDPDSK